MDNEEWIVIILNGLVSWICRWVEDNTKTEEGSIVEGWRHIEEQGLSN